MHNLDELVYRGTAFTLNALEEMQIEVIKSLQANASASSVKNLQMIQLQKIILAIGMFSLFDSIMQEGLACSNGFEEARKLLIKKKKMTFMIASLISFTP